MNRTVATNHGSADNDTHRDDGEAVADIAAGATSGAAPARGAKKSGGGKGNRRKPSSPSDIGTMLRGAYRETVDEAVPDDLMDLLNKLE